MNYKRLMATVLIVAMLGMILPMFPVSADIECMSYPIFEVLVEGETSWIDFVPDENPIYLEELTYGYGSTFEVEVWVRGVTDMFAYEFTLTWEKNYWLISAYVVEDVWPTQTDPIKPDLNYDLYELGYKKTTSYTQVVSALPPSTGVSGDIKLATLTFKIHTDIAYHEDDFETTFDVTGKLSDSCSQKIDYCDPHHALVYFCSAKPGIEMRPNNETNSAVGAHEKFTKEIWVTDVTKMKSLHFDLRWNKWGDADMVELHVLEWDEANTAHYAVRTPKTAVGAVHDYGDEQGIIVDFELKCTATNLRGEELRILTLTFVKLDPWPCGQPNYEYAQPHEWTPENATCMFYFYKGYFDVECPDLAYIYFGKIMKSPLGTLIDSETLFDGKGLPENYGTAEWQFCEAACSGGASPNLTTYIDGDMALVVFPVDNIPLDDINMITFEYYHTLYPGFPGPTYPGPRFILGINCTNENQDDIIVSESAPPLPHPCNEFEPTAASSPWWWHDWNASRYGTHIKTGNFTSCPITPGLCTFPTTNRLTDFTAVKAGYGSTCNVTFAGIMMCAHASSAAPASAIVDLVNIEIIYLGAGGNYNMTYELEPPGGRASWFDAGLYATEQEKIVNLYTFVPIPGDLNRDGVVDITDVLIIAQAYGNPTPDPLDLNDKDGVDIFDIVIVCKQFGRTSP